MKKYLLLIIISFGFFACTTKKADMIIYNGNIYTVNDLNPLVSAVAVKDGKILDLGDWKKLNKYKSDRTDLIDLDGKTMTPGLIEGHGHFTGLGESKLNLDLSSVKSYDELISVVESAIKNAQEGEWIIGRGWHQDKWELKPEKIVRGFQTHEKLSEISKNNPVWLRHASGHASFGNQKAMEIAGISKETEFGFGGEIIKDLSGNPTGIFNERAQYLISQYVDKSNDSTKVIKLAVEECLKNGITSFQDAGTSRKSLKMIRDAIKDNELKVRIYSMLTSRDESLLEEWYQKGPAIGLADDYLTVRSIKLNADGALGSRGAWLLDEYTDRPGHFGMATQPMKYVYDVSKKGIQNGFQVNTHAIGDRTNREVLDQYEKVFLEYNDLSFDHRWRIEHAQHVDPIDIPRFGKLGVIASIQGIHMSSDRPWAIDRLGEKRITEGAYAWRDLINSGAVLVNGSDVPVEPINPIACFYASVSRKTLSGSPNNGYEPRQKMTRMEALKSYTINAAYGAFEEDIKGAIEIGKYADFTVFSQNIMTVPESEILKTKITHTIVNGKVEYKLN